MLLFLIYHSSRVHNDNWLMAEQMMILVNGQERTINHFVDLYRLSGWEIMRVYQSGGLQSGWAHSLVEAVPI